MEPGLAKPARRGLRAVLVTPARADASRWLDVVRKELSLEVRCAATISDALDVVLDSLIDVAIVGMTCADGSYSDALKTLHLARPDLPVVLIAPLGGEALRAAYSMGAADVVAPAHLSRLAQAIVRALPAPEPASPHEALFDRHISSALGNGHYKGKAS